MIAPQRPYLLYILSSGRSGSTLIDLVLGSNPGLISVGEFHRLSLYARDEELCTCGAVVGDCPFWTDVSRSASLLFGGEEDPATTLRQREVMLRKDRIGRARNIIQMSLLSSGLRPPWWLATQMIGRDHAEAIGNSWVWMQAIAATTGCNVIVESTKDVRRLKQYFFSDPERVRVLHLTRDGRAVAASAMRRTACSMQVAAEEWLRKNRRIAAVLRGIPQSAIYRMRYEDFCADPTVETGRVLAFLGHTEPPRNVTLNKADRHNIGGNPMRFDRSVTRIELDTRWRSQLDAGALADFTTIAGRLNESLGYEA